MEVDPMTSQKTTVTAFRTSLRSRGASGAEQKPQNRSPSGLCFPQFGQVSTDMTLEGAEAVQSERATVGYARPLCA